MIHGGFQGDRPLPCPVERVWQTVTDLMNTAWRGDLARVEILNETHFVEHTKSGYATSYRYGLRAARWAFTMENGSMSGTWEGRGSLRRRRRRPANLHRDRHRQTLVDAPLVPGYLKRQQKRYLDDLRKELQK